MMTDIRQIFVSLQGLEKNLSYIRFFRYLATNTNFKKKASSLLILSFNRELNEFYKLITCTSW